MDFDDDDQDFFSRVDREDDPMGMEEPSLQPCEELLPPEDEGALGMDESSFQPSEELSAFESSFQPSEEVSGDPNPLPVVETDTSASSPDTVLPLRLDFTRRPRLLRKTKPQGAWADAAPVPDSAPAPPPSVPGVLAAGVAACEWWDKKSTKNKYLYVYTMIRRSSAYEAWKLTVRKKVRVRLPESWISLEEEHKREFLQWFVRCYRSGLAEPVKAWTEEVLLPKSQQGRGGHWKEKRDDKLRPGRQVLLTWQGPWGVIASDKMPAGSGAADVVEALKKEKYTSSLWTKAKAAAEKFAVELSADEWSASLELCTRTLATGVVRLHVHACFVSTTGHLENLDMDSLCLFGAAPHVSSENKKVKRQRRGAQFSTFYYLVAPKIGAVYAESTMRAHHDYEVNAEWIWSMVSMNKIELSACRRELIASGKNLVRHLQNLDILEKERQKEVVAAEMRSRDEKIAETRSAFKELKEVSAWVQDKATARDRRKFLVLDGASRLGKTAFACSLVPRGATLEVNCAGVTDPPLRAFSREKHQLILFDEASTELVLKNRRLFQAPNTPVTVGSSPTNALAYDLYLNDTLLVVASNNWEQELAALRVRERSWLEANMVFVAVKEKLFKEA